MNNKNTENIRTKTYELISLIKEQVEALKTKMMISNKFSLNGT